VDLAHRSTVDRPKGVTPDLIRTVHLRSSGWGSPRAAGGGAWPARGGGPPGSRRKFAGDLDLRLWCTVLSAVSSYAKLRSSRTYTGQKGGGTGDLDGAPWPAADDRPRHTAAMAFNCSVCRKKKGGRFLTLMRSCWQRRERRRSSGEGARRRRDQA
jgi:hypothetical protein